MSKIIKWFLEAFTKKYYKKNPIVTIFFYTLSFIAIYALFVNKTYLSSLYNFALYILKLAVLIFILAILKSISEKIKSKK